MKELHTEINHKGTRGKREAGGQHLPKLVYMKNIVLKGLNVRIKNSKLQNQKT